MRNAAMLTLVLVAGCLTNEPEMATQVDGLRCDPFCDPGEIHLESLQGAYDYGFAKFPDAVPIDHSCVELDTGMQQWDCVVSFVTQANPCGTIAVDCLARPGNPPRCNWMALDDCH